MLLSIIAAMDACGLIGDETGLPWHLPNDLRRFRQRTWGKPIIMGRRTFESIGKPLPGRFNIVLTQNREYSALGCRVARAFQEALSFAEDYLTRTGGDEVMVIGGGMVYGEAIQRCDRLYLTIVEGQFRGTTYFPVRELLRQTWLPACASQPHPADEKNCHRHTFHIIERLWDVSHRSPHQREGILTRASVDGEEALSGVDLAAILARGNMGS